MFCLKKYIYILALEIASHRHCASYIGTLAFPVSLVSVGARRIFFCRRGCKPEDRNSNILPARRYASAGTIYGCLSVTS